MQTTISLPRELSEQVENLRFAGRFPSRNATVLELVRAGIEVLAQRPATPLQSLEVR